MAKAPQENRNPIAMYLNFCENGTERGAMNHKARITAALQPVHLHMNIHRGSRERHQEWPAFNSAPFLTQAQQKGKNGLKRKTRDGGSDITQTHSD
jgi:hypothetical protein